MLPLKIHFPRWVATGKVKSLTWIGHLKVLWRIWDLRTLILLSLGLQITLILIAPFRKKTGNIVVVITIWLAYLLADYVAIQAIGLIPNYSARRSATNSNCNSNNSTSTHPDLLAFWAPFLLVHLGGPDPITALALEDNELWLRTALHLFTYITATGRVFFQSLPTNIIFLPTILMFWAGFFKYLERTLSLYYARLTKFKSSMLTVTEDADPEPNSANPMDSYDSYLTSALPDACGLHTSYLPELDTVSFEASPAEDQSIRRSNGSDEERVEHTGQVGNMSSNRGWLSSCLGRLRRSKERPMSNVILVRDAFTFFQKYKGLYVDLSFNLHDRNRSRSYFLQPSLTPKDAFTVLEIELNFTYEVFFTKMIVIHQKFGNRIRWGSFIFQLLSLLIWILFIDKDLFHWFDIGITYTLLVGAIVIDSIAFLAIALSDWQVATLSKKSKTIVFLYDKLLSARTQIWGSSKCSTSTPWVLLKRIFFRRWSESVFQFNLIDSCLHPWPNSAYIRFLIDVLQIKEECQGFKYVSEKQFPYDLRDFIFYELKYKAEIAQDPNDAREISDSRGNWVLRSLAGFDFDPFVLYRWTTGVEYDKCLLIWHIATELLYQTDDDIASESATSPARRNIGSSKEEEYRKHCKILSDYMMYLLNWQSGMMLAVAGTSEVRFRDTCGDLSILFDKVIPKANKRETKEGRLKTACASIMGVGVNIKTSSIKGDRRSKSVLLDAVGLAKTLKKMEAKMDTVGMWELMAKVWVELLGYSAMHCRANAHAAQLKQGGELLTLVWLLMVHFGFGKQFSVTEDNS